MGKKKAKRSAARTIKKKQTVGPKRKAGVKIGRNVVDQMWKMFQSGFSAPAISRACSVSKGCVLTYRRKEKWVERRDKITERANAKADHEQVTLLAENMKIVRFAKGKLLEQLKKIADGQEISKMPVTDLDKLIRLEEFLHGRPDSRPQLDYSKMSEEQLVVEMETAVLELSQIPECLQELQKLLASPTS